MFLRQRYSALLGGHSMTKITSLPTIAGALFVCGLSATPAAALANRTWVSGTGSNSNPCTLALPCKTFAFALTQTAAPGEIDVLAPGAYGPVTITQAISIVNDGVGVAAIGIAAGNAITINAGPTDNIQLRGLTIEGIGGATNDILFNSGGNLAIENCVVRGFASAGINIAPSTGSSSFSVSNTIASNNSSGSGILVRPTSSAVVTGVLSKVTANNNTTGIFVEGGFTTGALNVTIVNSVASNNSGTGVFANGGFAPAAVVVRNSDGIVILDNSHLKIATSRNYHHFFPTAYLATTAPNKKPNLIANITLIDGYSNKHGIGKKAPSKYIGKFAESNKSLSETLQTHLIKDIDTYGVNADDYDRFIERRAKAIALALNVKLMSMTPLQTAEAEQVQ
jgi:hypothetical protein